MIKNGHLLPVSAVLVFMKSNSVYNPGEKAAEWRDRRGGGILIDSNRLEGKQRVPWWNGRECACVCTRYHNTLVDPHIPVAALRAANPVLVKGSLNSWGHTSTHILTSCKLSAWAHTLNGFVLCVNMCIPGAWMHTPTASINCAWYPQVHQVWVIPVTNLCYSWHHLCYSLPDADYVFHQGSQRCHQSGNLTSTFMCVVICLYLPRLNSITPSVSTCLSELFLALHALQTK